MRQNASFTQPSFIHLAKLSAFITVVGSQRPGPLITGLVRYLVTENQSQHLLIYQQCIHCTSIAHVHVMMTHYCIDGWLFALVIVRGLRPYTDYGKLALPVDMIGYQWYIKCQRPKLCSEQEEYVEEDMDRILWQYQLQTIKKYCETYVLTDMYENLISLV